MTDEIEYYTADQEEKYVITQATTLLDENNMFKEEMCWARHKGEILEVGTAKVTHMDVSPKQIVPRLADGGTYVASESTFFRVLRDEELLAHRGATRPAEPRPIPRHVAEGPDQVQSWDITYLPSQVRGEFFYLYLFMDIWSRKIMGWAVEPEEDNEIAATVFVKLCEENDIDPEGLVLHSDNGPAMKGATMLATLQKLGVIKSFSRPSVSNDNAYSEAVFRTLKYRPGYPGRFESIEAARAWVAAFVAWYNEDHRHSAIRYVTPAQRHVGEDVAVLEQRAGVYKRARARRPNRWSNKGPELGANRNRGAKFA